MSTNNNSEIGRVKDPRPIKPNPPERTMYGVLEATDGLKWFFVPVDVGAYTINSNNQVEFKIAQGEISFIDEKGIFEIGRKYEYKQVELAIVTRVLPSDHTDLQANDQINPEIINPELGRVKDVRVIKSSSGHPIELDLLDEEDNIFQYGNIIPNDHNDDQVDEEIPFEFYKTKESNKLEEGDWVYYISTGSRCVHIIGKPRNPPI